MERSGQTVRAHPIRVLRRLPTLGLALAAAVATALVIFVVLAINGVDVTNVAGIVGSLAVGAATGFLQKQASDALGRYNDALGVLSANPA